MTAAKNRHCEGFQHIYASGGDVCLRCGAVRERPAASTRCPSLNPKSTRPDDQCERPAGHTGDHHGKGHSGSIVIYPSKWTDESDA